MILINQPYVSDFLKKTIKDNHFELIATKQAKLLFNDVAVNWVSEKDAINVLTQYVNPQVYTNSENALKWIFDNLKTTKLPEQINLFKDKFKFRELVKELFPNFQFSKVELSEIQNLKANQLKMPFVIKPSIGFFSIGVHVVNTIQDLEKVKKELNYDNLKSIYPQEVMDSSTFIIEEYIQGEEYAVDTYFNEQGEVVILNILHHIFSSTNDVSDRVYSTSQNIIKQYKEPLESFLKLIGNKANLKNFPLHLEVRIDKKGVIKPIEINPLRFGGWCTTGDLAWHAYGLNPYAYFILNKKPNWNKIFKDRPEKIYSIIILDNNSGYQSSEISYFDFEMLQDDFENVLEVRKLDIKIQPVFGFVFTETSTENKKELDNILTSNLRKYIRVDKDN